MDEGVIRAAFIPFGDISEVQVPIDYQTEKHRGFAFVEFELPEDAKAAIDNMVGVECNCFLPLSCHPKSNDLSVKALFFKY